MGRIYCVAPSCKNNSAKKPELSFYRFPKDKERCKRWVINTRRSDLFKKPPKHLYNNFRLCAKHFERSQIVASKKLVFNAVPTLFDVPNPPPRLVLKRKLPEKRALKTPAACAKHELEVHHTYASSSVETQGRILGKPSDTSSNSAHVQKDVSVTGGQELYIPLSRHQAEIQRLQNVFKTERAQSYRLRRKIKHLEKKLTETKKNSINSVGGVIEHAGKYLSGLSLQLFSNQLRIANRNVHGRRYTDEDFALATKLYNLGPKTYNVLSQIFSLPTKQSLRRVARLGSANSGKQLNQTEEQTCRLEELVNGSEEELSRMEEQMSQSEEQMRGLGIQSGDQIDQLEGQVSWKDGNGENDCLLLAIAQSGLSKELAQADDPRTLCQYSKHDTGVSI